MQCQHYHLDLELVRKCLKFIFDNYLIDSHDSIIIDNTRSENKIR